MIAARQRFQDKNKANAWHWQSVCDTEAFQEAASAALVEMAGVNTAPPDLATAASWQWRMDGAKQFLSILMSLTESTPERKLPNDNLDWKA